jgi:hypothetical protein
VVGAEGMTEGAVGFRVKVTGWSESLEEAKVVVGGWDRILAYW